MFIFSYKKCIQYISYQFNWNEKLKYNYLIIHESLQNCDVYINVKKKYIINANGNTLGSWPNLSCLIFLVKITEVPSLFTQFLHQWGESFPLIDASSSPGFKRRSWPANVEKSSAIKWSVLEVTQGSPGSSGLGWHSTTEEMGGSLKKVWDTFWKSLGKCLQQSSDHYYVVGANQAKSWQFRSGLGTLEVGGSS